MNNQGKRPAILAKFHRMMQLNKPLYVEAYKLVAATTEVIKAKPQPDFSAVSYYACLQELLSGSQQEGINQDALMYVYSAVVSMLDLGIISNQQHQICAVAKRVMFG